MRRRATALMASVAALSISGCGGRGTLAAPPSTANSTTAATRFLSRYVTADGRVIRHDQGGDITSEGQAYAMLIAEAAGRPALARTVWSWTSAHLARSDGLFAWHATGAGNVVDPQSATDADVLIAYALMRYAGPDEAALHTAGRRVAGAALANESVVMPDGAPLPVAGPWAKSGSPPTVNPSYLMPGVFDALGRLTGDQRWNQAARTSVSLIGELTINGRRLPSEWAQLTGSRLVPAGQPGGGAPVQYSFAAARTPIWFAASCDTAARTLAGSWWRNVLRSGGRAGSAALSLTGATLNGEISPVSLLAGAAAAASAGDTSAARDLRARADAVASRNPTYYGDAWAALAPAPIISPCGAST